MKLRILKSGTSEARQFISSLARRRASDGDEIDSKVARIIAEVRRDGDRALIEFTREFDGVALDPLRLRVSPSELHAARERLPIADREALELAANRIEEFHRRTVDQPFVYRDRAGMRLGQIVQPIQRVGVYVPGGAAAYPSTVLMNAIPAKVAGVEEIVMVSPTSREGDRISVLAAAALAGVDEFYRVGGAQAVAALAYGTETIRPVDKIVGPGNAWVQAAKRMVYGVVDIDKMAGPSEVLIIADDTARADWTAADLIAQAEHGSGEEAAILVTSASNLATQVAREIERELKRLPRAKAVTQALSKRGAIIVVGDLKEAFDLANEIAPEHLELAIRTPSRWLPRVKSAGAVFLGAMTPAPLGDYLAGPNHVLPTGGAARFASPLGAYDFLKRTSIIEASTGAMAELGPTVAHLARMEGLEGHARAIEMRQKANQKTTKAQRH